MTTTGPRLAQGLSKLLAINFLCLLVLVASLPAKVTGRWINTDHCYSDIGCFPLSAEFYHPRHRPFNVRPWHRRRINTRFELYSRKQPHGILIQPWDGPSLRASGFDPKLETKIIVPGWLDNISRALWVRRMRDALLWLWHPVNIIVVHWRNFTPYTIATANTRVVGAELANLLRFIEHELHYDRSFHHLIGHSLGAHISGYCGDRLPGLGRITALDPARPFFQHMPKSVRLDRGDARFVDAIHSDFTPENAILLFMSFGMTTPVGHLDFYPNGPPLLQPGCLRDTVLSVRNGIQRGLEHASLPVAFLESIRYLTACDHQRSHEWFIESITNRHCTFVGVRCNQFEGVINGRCTCDNSRSACAIMGIHADQMYLHNAHQDLWPTGSQTAASYPSESLWRPDKPLNGTYKNEAYAKLKAEAQRLRHPPRPQILIDEPPSATLEADLLAKMLNEMPNDQQFIEYLRANFAHLDTSQLQTTPIVQRRQHTLNEDDDLGLTYHLFKGISEATGHPPLLSDIDRDIENWYEDTSRWFLKTNRRSNYCVNQYQVLVFIGPLKSTSGLHHIRANLIISIIGSRGKLMNQRFVPRASQLDSYTMQPFFILLEGSYSLGNILSVAVGWEARSDPDPVQATVSFQSNLLEAAQTFLPSYKAKHPWLPETMKYDHSAAFHWTEPRADHLEKQTSVKKSDSDEPLGVADSLAIELDCDQESCSAPMDTEDHDGILGNELMQTSASQLIATNQLDPLGHLARDYEPLVEAELHNIGIHLDRDPEDSIVISQVLVSPLHATYGKDNLKVGKLFCPPFKNFRLEKDTTVHLKPSLLGRCSPDDPRIHGHWWTARA